MKTEPNDTVYPERHGHPADYRPSLTKLEAFTMAAMQGLCANAVMLTGKRDTISNETLGVIAVNIAKSTIETLNKEEVKNGLR